MKVKITRTDGTVIEAEGTAQECSEFAQAIAPAALPSLQLSPSFVPVPVQQRQQVFPWEIFPETPWQVVPYQPYVPSTTPHVGPWINPPVSPSFEWWQQQPTTTVGVFQLCQNVGGGHFDMSSGLMVNGTCLLSDGALASHTC